ncbi:M30 family zinc metallopeptidase [Roseateles sp. NT4]|uniref:M30 family zinc metallopeptidase n=1 Tax=Roseateles sp. NT4 TaxID=3453715 RepID=UPI003EF02C53
MTSQFKAGLRHVAAASALLLLTACGGGGGGGSTPTPAPPTPPTPAPVVADPVLRVSASSSQLYAGEYVQFIGGDSQSGVTWRWEFSDGTTADGVSVERRFVQAGSFTATAVAQNSAGVTVRASTTVQVEAQPAPVVRAASTILQPGCSGLHCGVAADGRYAGSGVGVWRMRNAGTASQLVDVDIGGVQAGQAVTLVFSNGQSVDATELPKSGLPAAASLAAAPNTRMLAADGADTGAGVSRLDAGHARSRGLQQRQALDDLHGAQPVARAATEPRRRALAAGDVGSTRIWNDLYDDETKPVPFTASVLSTCSIGATGRRLVFWVDQELTTAHTVEAAHVEPLKRSFCGDQGGFARVIALLGDVWGGTEVGKRSWLVQETPAQQQDVNIVVTNHMGSSNDVAGYFYGLNNSYRWRSARYANSNEALAFFVSGSGLAGNPSFYASTLVHELTHMVNYHQRTIQRGVLHDDWLEESSAMATEDLLAETVTPGINKIVNSRLPAYLRSGGITSMTDWLESSSSTNYAAGGSLAAFLNRRFGSGWTKQLVSDCGDDSYACLDALIKRAGGEGLADEWERLGSSVFGGMPQRHAPWGYGFPQVQWEGFWLMGVDTAQQANARKVAPVSGVTRFGSTGHTYLDDQVAAGATRYVRRGVRVPAGTVLTVVVR